MSGNIKVVVRCRPLNSREIARGAKCLIRMEAGTHTFLEPPDDESNSNSGGTPKSKPSKTSNSTDRETKSFAFDHSYWSACPKDEPGYASQETLYKDLGVDLLNNSFEGYNSCIFAYGQTGSGKSYSMMGYGQDRGIIPLTCSALFDRIKEKMEEDPNVVYTVEVSFMEIYNERVRDLLNPKNKGNLRVREHPSLGPYVEDLSKLAVRSYADVETLMDEGNKARTVAATNMNETSSRSHSVFTLLLTQRRKDLTTGMEGEKVSRISLVDLAGSERANSTGATGVRLKEGAQINKSLTTLGKVISALAAAGAASGPGKKKKADEHIPYRDSVLTWLLKDSLGGNSKTAMIAAISPADYDETLSTLRYADQAKKIKNKAVVNEDPNAKLIRELKEELLTLRSRISGNSGEDTYDVTLPPEKQIVKYQTKTGEIKTVTKAALQEQLEQSEKLMSEVAQTWEEKLMKTEIVQKEREQALEELGITIEKNNVGVHTPKRMPHLVNLNEDPLMSECLIYQIKPGKTTVGNTDGSEACDIRLSGSNILSPHCHFESDKESGTVQLFAHENAPTMVNGQRLSPGVPRKLRSGYRVILGDYHIFRFNHPEEVRKHREKVKSTAEGGKELMSPLLDGNGEPISISGSVSPLARPDTPTTNSVTDPQDYHYARKEAVISKLNGTEVNLDEMDEAEFEKLFDDVVRLRMHRKSGTSLSGRESRMSYISEEEDDLLGSLRPQSGSTFVTDDTSLGESNLEELNQGFRAAFGDEEDRIKLANGIGRSSLGGGENGIETEQIKLEREQMENQMKVMKQEMEQKLEVEKQKFRRKVKNLKTKSRRNSINVEFEEEDEGSEFDLEEYSEPELRLLRRSIKKWKALNNVKLAEKILMKAIVLKEANVISRELNKMVTYQFILLDRSPFEVGSSSLESIKGLNEFDDVSDPVLSDRSNRPYLGIKVLDQRHRSIYVWSLDKLEHRLSQMRNLFNFIDKPEFSQHFNWEDPFYDPFPPTYSFIAQAFIPLGPLYRNMGIKSNLPIYSPYTLSPIGSCQVRIRIIGIAPPPRTGILLNSPNGLLTPTGVQSVCPLGDGSKITLEILVDEVKGLASRDFSSVHVQIRHSSITGSLRPGTDDQVFSSKAFDLPCDGNEIVLKNMVTITLSPETKRHLVEGCGVVEFFGQVMPSYLDRLERIDEKKNENSQSNLKINSLSPVGGTTVESNGFMRQPETEFVCEQSHDVSTSFQMLELSAGGDYEPTPIVSQNGLDPGAFFLRQGLQRKLWIRLGHNSGRQFGWRTISKVEMGNVRLIDGQGRVHGSKVEKWVTLKASKKVIARFESDGTSTMEFLGNWDAGGHESSFLNRVTLSQQRVLIELRMNVEVKDCIEPIEFKTDVAMTIKERDHKSNSIGSNFLSLLKLERRLKRMNFLFSVKLKPITINRVEELWRLNTMNQIITGEEKLNRWKARSVEMLIELNEFKESIRLKNEVENLKIIVNCMGLNTCSNQSQQQQQAKVLSPTVEDKSSLTGSSSSSTNNNQNNSNGIVVNGNNKEVDLFKIGKSLELWQKRFGPKQKMKFLDEANKPIGSKGSSKENNGKKDPSNVSNLSEGISSLGSRRSDEEDLNLRVETIESLSKTRSNQVRRSKRLRAEVKLVPKHENSIKKGKMNVLRDPTQNDWVNRWFVLKRPYLYIYEKSDEVDELGVINLINVHIDSNPELEQMLNRKNVFAIYSSTNSYFLETLNFKELNEWSLAIKPLS